MNTRLINTVINENQNIVEGEFDDLKNLKTRNFPNSIHQIHKIDQEDQKQQVTETIKKIMKSSSEETKPSSKSQLKVFIPLEKESDSEVFGNEI